MRSSVFATGPSNATTAVEVDTSDPLTTPCPRQAPEPGQQGALWALGDWPGTRSGVEFASRCRIAGTRLRA